MKGLLQSGTGADVLPLEGVRLYLCKASDEGLSIVGDATTDSDPVTLHEGTPLYGDGADAVYIPFMRTTGVNIDQAGNVWACNNWKPNFELDHEVNGNPGGDGMVIFIGLAKPPAADGH